MSSSRLSGNREVSSDHSPRVFYRTAEVEGLNIFYREAGSDNAPTVVLLHGFPSSSHMFRNLMPLLADHYHVIAPDYPGFGYSDAPTSGEFDYTFDHLAKIVGLLLEQKGVARYSIYIQDYGSPVGFRLATAHPERVETIVSQNGNAYEEGLSDGWNPIRSYWQDPSAANREALRAFLTPETTHWQYTHGVGDQTAVSPDGQSLDNYYLARPDADEVQRDP